VSHFLAAIFAAAAFYQILALIACVRQMLRREPPPRTFPPVSILKPVRGADSAFYNAIRSHAEQDYPGFELLFGVSDSHDPALRDIERLAAAYPDRSIRVIHSSPTTPNRKAGVLADLAKEARGAVLVVNDGDIRVPDRYLRDVVAPIVNGEAGLVTCLYNARAESFPARFEALGIATDFAPSALVAPMVGVNEFGMGSTLAFEASTLRAIGGFEAVAPYIADDYQVGKRISRLGRRVRLSNVVVETHLHGETWGDVWRHQLRWARTIRVSRGGGYAGLPVANASLWAVLAASLGMWWWAAGLIVARYVVALVAATGVLKAWDAARLLPLAPLRDLWGFAIWAAGLVGNEVEWGGERLRLDGEGRIKR
jgi:ceramide glucosyltransferase